MRVWGLVFIVASALSGSVAKGAVVFEALSSFGGDGWLSPAEAPTVLAASGDTQRGMAYSASRDHLYVVDRRAPDGTTVRILNATTGAALGTLQAPAGGFTGGGTFTGNMVAVGDDGAIYMGSLSTSATQNFKVYRWADPTAAPTVAFDGLTNRSRTGDSFSVTGSGVNTRIIAAGGNISVAPGTAGVALLTTTDGVTFTPSNVTPAAPATDGSFRLGLDFVDPTTIIGKSTSSDFILADTLGGPSIAITPTSAGEGPLAAFSQGVDRLLASVDVNTSQVRIYDLNAIGNPLFQTLPNLVPQPDANNANGVGDVDFGVDSDGFIRLYAMNTNNGIQAFRSVTAVPEPSSLALLSLVGAGFIARRRRRRATAAV